MGVFAVFHDFNVKVLSSLLQGLKVGTGGLPAARSYSNTMVFLCGFLGLLDGWDFNIF